MADKINLGDLAEDRISGYRGVVIARTQWLRGCDRLTIQPRTLHDGKPVEAQSFDEPDLVLLEKNVLAEPVPTPAAKTGGPRPEPSRGR